MNRVLIGILIGFLVLGKFDSGVQPDSATGVASYYKSGKITANGEPFSPHGITAAQPHTATYPLERSFALRT